METQINSVKSWIQETKEYLGNPTIEIEAQLEELQVPSSPSSLYPSFKNVILILMRYVCLFSVSIELKFFRNAIYKKILLFYIILFYII